MRTWILIALELVVAIALGLAGYSDVALGIACGGTLAMTVYLWPVGRD